MAERKQSQVLYFGPYQITGYNGQLLLQSRPLPLSPKAVAVLWTLVRQAGHLVHKEYLFRSVWPEAIVSDGVLANRIRELRQVLGDTARQHHYIETVHRRGYRFVAAVTTASTSHLEVHVLPQDTEQNHHEAKTEPDRVKSTGQQLEPPFVGREQELAQLQALLAKALKGERQIVFVTGEAGIGKTALTEAFLGRAETWELGVRSSLAHGQEGKSQFLHPRVWITWGQCVEHYGAGEAYLPVLEAVSRLCRQAEGPAVLNLLRRVAPSWLVQLPALLSEAEHTALQQRMLGTTRARMLREMAEALEALSTEQPVVMILEDLHWSDISTLDLLSMLARRREAARLLLLATYRPADVVVHDHSCRVVKQELLARGLAVELPLSYLPPEAVQAYLCQQVGGLAEAEPELAPLIHARTEGHPLFMVQLVADLVQRETFSLDGQYQLPSGLRQFLLTQLERLTATEQAILEAGSVIGVEFSAASVAAGVGRTSSEVEAICDQLVQREQFISERQMQRWPDGTVSGQYVFRHGLYQEALYQRLSASRRVRLHSQIGLRREAAYGERAQEIAAELAMHFEQGQDIERAIQYRYYASQNAEQRSAYVEALTHVTAGLSLLTTASENPLHRQQELKLQLALASVLQVTKGSAAAESAAACARALELARECGTTAQAFEALHGLWNHAWMSGISRLGLQQGEQLLAVAEHEHDAALRFVAHRSIGGTLCYLGEFTRARTHFEQALIYADSDQVQMFAAFSTKPYREFVSAYLAHTLWHLGYIDQARARMQEAVERATIAGFAYPIAATSLWSAVLEYHLRNEHAVYGQSARVLQLSTSQGFPQWAALGTVLHEWAQSGHRQDLNTMLLAQQAVAAYQASGAYLGLPYILGVLAEVYRREGKWKEALDSIDKAFAIIAQTDERFHEAELWRLRGELLLPQVQVPGPEFAVSYGPNGNQKREGRNFSLPGSQSEVEACFFQALAVARQQQAKSLELRAVMSLVRLRQQQVTHWEVHSVPQDGHRKLSEARQMLSDVYHWFTEGLDTRDLQEARALLDTPLWASITDT